MIFHCLFVWSEYYYEVHLMCCHQHYKMCFLQTLNWVLLRGRRARFNSCSEIFSFWEYSYKLLTNLEGPAALVRELDSFLIPYPLADPSIEWLQLFHQNIENGIWWFLQSVLYMGILAMTSKIYIVINYRKVTYFVGINNKFNFYRWISLKQQEKIVIFVLWV